MALAVPPAGSVFTWTAFNRVVRHQTEISVTVTFRPRSSAIERATLRFTSTAAGSPHTVGLLGKGIGGFPTPGPFDERPTAAA